MNWYFDNEGDADGPHDEPAMTSYCEAGKIVATTLVWQPEMDLWQEAGTLQPAWWVAAPVQETPPATAPPSRQPSKLKQITIAAPPVSKADPSPPAAPVPSPALALAPAPAPAPAAVAANAAATDRGPPTESRRAPIPSAPTGALPQPPKAGLLRRLFGAGRKA